MTRKALIELVQRRLKFTDSVKQFPALYVQGVMDLMWQQLVTDTYNDDIQDINFYTKKYTAVTVVEEIDNKLYYSDIPEEILRLPRIGEGVISINQLESRGSDFKPIREQDFRLMTTQESFRVGSDIYYFVEYSRIYYGQSMTDEIVSSGVNMNLCIPFSKYDMDEELPLPAGQSSAFVNMAIEYLSGTPVVNTNNKNEL